MTNEFQPYELVKLAPSAPVPDVKSYHGQEGHVLGVYDNDDGSISYSVVFYPRKEDWDSLIDEEWSRKIQHEHLISTGRIGKKEDHFTGDTLRVRPDGSVVNDD